MPIAPIAARRFDASEVGEVELNNGFERLGGRTASPTATSETRLRRSTFSQCINGPLVVRYLSVADIRPAERNARDRRDRTVGAGAECQRSRTGCIQSLGVFRGVAAAYRRLRGRDGLGGGDAELLASAGAWCGLAALPLVVLGSALLGMLAALGLALMGRSVTSTTRIPFGPCIALAFWLVRMHSALAEDLLRSLGRF